MESNTMTSSPISDINHSEIQSYINSLPDKERVAYEIATSHLGTSFTVEKTVGFLRWRSTNELTGK